MSDLLLNRKREDMVSLFRWQQALLEELLPRGWFDKAHPTHRAFIRWEICKALVENGAHFPIGAPPVLHREIASMCLDALLLCSLSDGNAADSRVGTFDNYGDAAFVAYRQSRATLLQGFDDLMTELAYGAWEKLSGANVTPLEISGAADMIIHRQSGLRVVAECKRLTVDRPNRIRAIVRKASGQLVAASQDLPGLLVVDITSALKDTIRAGGEFVGDAFDTTFAACLRGHKNRGVSAVLLLWDHFEHELSDSHGLETLMQRRSQILRHDNPRCAWPPDAPVFDGLTVYSQLGPGSDIKPSGV